jgi:hypothetical protein
MRDPVMEEELKRDFRPFEIVECNMPRVHVGSDGRKRILQRRIRMVRFVNIEQTRVREIITDLGPASNEQPFAMPCDGQVEMAQALELFGWAKRASEERRARSELIKPERDRAFLNGIADVADEWTKRKLGLSTFGPGGKLQRVKV